MPKPKKPEKKKPSVQPRPGQSFVREINDALLDEDYEQAAKLAIEGMKRFPTHPDFPEKLAEALVELNANVAALVPAQRLLELTPNRLRSLHLAALVYYNNDLFAHSARCARRFLEIAPEDPAKESLQGIRSKGDAMVQATARRMKVSVEDAEEGIHSVEEANLETLLGANDSLVIEHLRRAVLKLPKASSARGALGEALYKSGLLDETESVCRETLKTDASDIDANWLLMLCARARYDDEALQKAYAPLKKKKDYRDPILDPIQLARAHGLMGDHARAYDCARQVAESEIPLPSVAHYVLGAAAANTGRIQEAKGYFRLYADHGGVIGLEIDSLTAGLPGPNVASAYPYFDETNLLTPSLFEEISIPIQDRMDSDEFANGVYRIDLSAKAERIPQSVWIAEKFFLEKDIWMGLGMLLSLGTERSLQIVRDAAASAELPWNARITAATALMDHGFLKEGETLRIWNGSQRVEIGPKEIRALLAEQELPETVREGIIESGRLYDKDPQGARNLLLSLLERYPDIPMLHHNLGLIEKSEERMKARLTRALELKPDYDFARATLASICAYMGGADGAAEAEAVLSHFGEDHLFNPVDYISVLYARALIERARNRYDEAIAILRRILRESYNFHSAFELLIRLEKAKEEGRIDVNPTRDMRDQLLNAVTKPLDE